MLNESVIKVLKNGMWDFATCAKLCHCASRYAI